MTESDARLIAADCSDSGAYEQPNDTWGVVIAFVVVALAYAAWSLQI